MPILDAWNRELGTSQGRLKSGTVAPVAGDYVFCIGFDRPLREEDLSPGDFAQLEQTSFFNPGTKLLRVTAIIRPPSAVPTGQAWYLQILLNDKVYVQTRLKPGGRTRTRQFGVNVSKLPFAAYNLTLRLVLLTSDSQQYITQASYDMGTGNDDVFPMGINSGESFGAQRVAYLKVVTPTAIASAQAFGTSKLNQIFYPTGIASANVFGTTTVHTSNQFITDQAISSAYASGTAKLNRNANLTGLSSAYASGTAKLNQNANLTGLSSAYASGTQQLVKVPNGQNLTGWWKSPYVGGSTWSGSASAGTSGSHTMAPGSAPSSSSVGTFSYASFAASSSNYLQSANALFSASALHGWMLFNVASSADLTTNGIPGTNASSNTTLLGSTGASWFYLYVRSNSGSPTIGLGVFNGSANVEVETGFSVGSWQLAQWEISGTTGRIRINGNALNSATIGSIGSTPASYDMARSISGTIFLKVGVLQCATSPVATSSFTSDMDDVRAYINYTYGSAGISV